MWLPATTALKMNAKFRNFVTFCEPKKRNKKLLKSANIEKKVLFLREFGYVVRNVWPDMYNI